jgi:CDP-3, 6-dideoxy-D-glycero-L-glycero-4-hexulose-4-reductase
LKKIVVSGFSGFIGSHLVQRLKELGHEVWGIQRLSSHIEKTENRFDRIIFYDGSIDSLLRSFAKIRPDVAIHLASKFLTSHTSSQIEDLMEANIVFGAKFIEACFVSKVKSFINTGTAWQRFNGNSYLPVNLYAATKEAFEKILAYYDDLKFTRSLTLRLGDTYGQNDPRKKIISILFDSINSQNKVEMSGGEQIINLVHVEDVCDAYVHAMDINELPDTQPGSIFAVRGKESLSLKDLVAKIEDVTKKSLNVEFGVKAYRDREVFIPENLTPNLPGWEPKYTLEQGLKNIAMNIGIIS